MKLFKLSFDYKEGEAIPARAIFELSINKEDNYAVRLIFTSPFLKVREYHDPIDFSKKVGLTRLRKMALNRKSVSFQGKRGWLFITALDPVR